MRTSTRTPLCICLVSFVLSSAVAQDKLKAKLNPTKFTPVNVHIQKGRYAEALEALEALE